MQCNAIQNSAIQDYTIQNTYKIIQCNAMQAQYYALFNTILAQDHTNQSTGKAQQFVISSDIYYCRPYADISILL